MYLFVFDMMCGDVSSPPLERFYPPLSLSVTGALISDASYVAA